MFFDVASIGKLSNSLAIRSLAKTLFHILSESFFISKLTFSLLSAVSFFILSSSCLVPSTASHFT
jgi:hypothetical protein